MNKYKYKKSLTDQETAVCLSIHLSTIQATINVWRHTPVYVSVPMFVCLSMDPPYCVQPGVSASHQWTLKGSEEPQLLSRTDLHPSREGSFPEASIAWCNVFKV